MSGNETMLVKSESLTSVADSIRAKSGKTDALTFPDGFKSAVDGLPTVTVNGNIITANMNLIKTGSADMRFADLPAVFYNGCAAIDANGAPHILGGSLGTTNTGHYMHNGASWVSRTAIPGSFTGSNACCSITSGAGKGVHLIGVNSDFHYAYAYSASGATTGTTWTRIGNAPYSADEATAAVCNGYIHLLGGSNGPTSHYRWTPSTGWKGVAPIPTSCTGCRAVELNKQLHVFGGSLGKAHYAYNDATNAWTANPKETPVSFTASSAVVHKGILLVFGGSYNPARSYFYANNLWSAYWSMTVKHQNAGNTAVVFDGLVHVLGSNYASSTSGEGLAYSKMDYCPRVSAYVPA